MALIDQYAMAQVDVFRQRVTMAMVTKAMDVMADTAAAGSGAVALAQRILDSPDGYAERFALATASNATIAASAPTGEAATDGDIQWTVNEQVFPRFVR